MLRKLLLDSPWRGWAQGKPQGKGTPRVPALRDLVSGRVLVPRFDIASEGSDADSDCDTGSEGSDAASACTDITDESAPSEATPTYAMGCADSVPTAYQPKPPSHAELKGVAPAPHPYTPQRPMPAPADPQRAGGLPPPGSPRIRDTPAQGQTAQPLACISTAELSPRAAPDEFYAEGCASPTHPEADSQAPPEGGGAAAAQQQQQQQQQRASSSPPSAPAERRRPVLTKADIFGYTHNGARMRRKIKWAHRPMILDLLLKRLPYTGCELSRYSLYTSRQHAARKEELTAEVMGAHLARHHQLLRELHEGSDRGVLSFNPAPRSRVPQGAAEMQGGAEGAPRCGSLKTDRLMGAFMGLACGDCLGAPMEFKPVRYSWGPRDEQVRGMAYHLGGFGQRVSSRFNLKGGQWTDDTSMALCLADSLLEKQGFDALDIKLRFSLWWLCGYNNAFARDRQRENKTSVGLGGNISHAFVEFMRDGYAYTRQGNRDTSGNGSLMRNAPVALFYHRDLKTAMLVSKLQSLTTHRGEEAAELCKLLTFIIIRCATHKSEDPEEVKHDVLGNLTTTFDAVVKSVGHLAASECETSSSGDEWAGPDRDWRWKAKSYRFSPARAAAQPGYVGSYAMDCMAMALHIVWTTDSFSEALLRAANQCGDADTVAAVVGQIAGSIYGLQRLPRSYLSGVMVWDNGGDILLRAWKLTQEPA